MKREKEKGKKIFDTRTGQGIHFAPRWKNLITRVDEWRQFPANIQ